MASSTTPEIQRSSLTTAMLYLKTLPLDIDVLNFDFLDRPSVRSSIPEYDFALIGTKKSLFFRNGNPLRRNAILAQNLTPVE